MSRRSKRRKTKRVTATKPAESVPEGEFALNLALAMRMSKSGTDPDNAVAQNRDERLDALTVKMVRGV